MRFGLFTNGNRLNQVARLSYDADLQEIILADKLGMEEAWISEHGTLVGFQAPDQLPSADLFICKAAALTKQIRMGPGIRALPYYHPLQVATDVAVCDHLTNGRYLAGFGVGLGGGRGVQRGKLPGPARAMFHEAVDMILTAWSAQEPFDWPGQFWQGEQCDIIPKPLTEIEVGIACSRTEGTLEFCAEKSFYPLISWNPSTQQIKGMIESYLHASNKRGKPPARDRVRVSRVVYVADSVNQARRELHGADFAGAVIGGRMDHFIPEGGSRADLTMEYFIDNEIFFCGEPDRVTRQIRDLYEEVGGFGVLLLVAGKDWATPRQRARAMRRFMTEVAPKLTPLVPAPVPAAA
jgi:alkanesulfonate monooxygenase SsuD/methylene tetrahydromethanopterin reductase-like flavin-dependent oxidoreductase (luciferase family)